MEKQGSRQKGLAPLLLVIIMAVVALLMSTAIAMAAMYIGYLGKGDPASWEEGEIEEGEIAGSTGYGGRPMTGCPEGQCGSAPRESCGSSWWSQPTDAKGSYVNGNASGLWVPCFPHDVAGKCGCACASELIYAYTGQYIDPDSLTTRGERAWAGVLNSRTGMRWAKSSYKVDKMAAVISYIQAGYPVIFNTKNPKGDGSVGGDHIMVATQYDKEKDAFLVHNSLPGICRLQWVSKSFFLKHPHTQRFKFRAPDVKFK